MKAKKLQPVTLCVAALLTVAAILPAQTASTEPKTKSKSSEVDALKKQLAEQQKQIDQLKLALEDQKKLIEQNIKATAAEPKNDFALPRKALGEVASTTPIIPATAAPISSTASVLPLAAAINAAQPPAAAPKNPCEANPEGPTPAFIRLGSTCLVPVGFMDLTAVWRDKNAGSSIGTNFGSVPYNNVVNGKLSEFRFSPQNSRIGFRFDGDWKGTHFIGYNEFDFLGTGAGTNYTVTNGAFVPRLRLFWVDARKGQWEFLAGQSWSMLVPNRKGISALPGDLFYSQVIDVNYMAGLTWTRQPGMRVLYHPNKTVTVGFSAENPDQYIGGSAGGSGITLPGAFSGLAATQLDNAPNISVANTVLAVPTVHPDFIAKIAFDPSPRFHFDVAGIERTFKIVNPNTLALGQYNTKAGGGFQFGLNGEIIKNLRLISTNYWSDGGGRYLFGQAPDVIVRADGSLSLVHSGGTVDGFEARVKNWLLYAYYGDIYIGRNTAIDTNGSKIGYGYSGSPNSQNRALNEITFGFNQTIWSSPRYGAINAMGQYEWMSRNPWFVALGAPKGTHDNTIYFNLRYTLPGSMPSF
ncbi:MAG: SlyX family protein [Acidobacteriia bacterium]|nr:SlyX family protein [Terriglobia bacterium]